MVDAAMRAAAWVCGVPRMVRNAAVRALAREIAREIRKADRRG